MSMLNVDVECKRRERHFKSPGSAVRDSCSSAGRDVSVITNRREGCFCYYVVSVISFCRVGKADHLSCETGLMRTGSHANRDSWEPGFLYEPGFRRTGTLPVACCLRRMLPRTHTSMARHGPARPMCIPRWTKLFGTPSLVNLSHHQQDHHSQAQHQQTLVSTLLQATT